MKRKKLKVIKIKKNNRNLRITYLQYIDDWIITTNIKEKKVKRIKKRIYYVV